MWRILNEKARHVFGLCVGRHTLVDTYVGIHTSGYACTSGGLRPSPPLVYFVVAGIRTTSSAIEWSTLAARGFLSDYKSVKVIQEDYKQVFVCVLVCECECVCVCACVCV